MQFFACNAIGEARDVPRQRDALKTAFDGVDDGDLSKETPKIRGGSKASGTCAYDQAIYQRRPLFDPIRYQCGLSITFVKSSCFSLNPYGRPDLRRGTCGG